jgi:hypothetical protein
MGCATLPSQWFLTPARLRVATSATIAQIQDVSSKEGAVIGVEMGILSTLKRLLMESRALTDRMCYF